MTAAARVSGERRALGGEARRDLERLLARVLDEHSRAGRVSVVLVGDEEIRALHRDYLGEDRPTDVLSFPFEEEGGDPHGDDLLGEVVVSVDTARREAKRRSVPVEREVTLYALHGVLHLVGFDDRTPRDRARMRRAERRYLDGCPDG